MSAKKKRKVERLVRFTERRKVEEGLDRERDEDVDVEMKDGKKKDGEEEGVRMDVD